MKHTPTPEHRTRAAAALLAAGCALLLFLAIPGNATPDNQGTIKVHNPGDVGDESNDPHVGCSFFVEGFNMEAASGTLVIKSWPPTGDMSVVVDTTWAADDDEDAGHHFLNGPYSLGDGHYKVFVSDEQHDKMKTFWVECQQPCERDCGTGTTTETGTTQTGTTDTGTTTQVPVFPTAASLALGGIGALGGAFLVLRRRL